MLSLTNTGEHQLLATTVDAAGAKVAVEIAPGATQSISLAPGETIKIQAKPAAEPAASNDEAQGE